MVLLVRVAATSIVFDLPFAHARSLITAVGRIYTLGWPDWTPPIHAGLQPVGGQFVSPDEQVPKRYRALIVETIDGQVFKGTVVYESVDGITMLTGNGETVRINRQDMEQRRMSAKSLMPAGLLDTADDEKWADLFAYLSTL